MTSTERSRRYREKHKNLELCVNCPSPVFESKTRCKKCIEKYRKNDKNRNRQLKQEVIDAYGGKCKCCEETTFEFLTIDHIKNDGVTHRKITRGSGSATYRWLKKHNFPKRGFQLLCYNCNCAKGFFGKCPHKNRV